MELFFSNLIVIVLYYFRQLKLSSYLYKNTGVDSLYLPQWIFPTQELNWGLLHCRWILYQLRYEGSLMVAILYVISRWRVL